MTGLFDDFNKKLQDLANTKVATFPELFPPAFMQRYTKFGTMEEMLEASGYVVESQADFEAIPKDRWDGLVRSRTKFADWEAMKEQAGAEWAKRKLGL